MVRDDEDDLFDEEFDFVDEDDSELEDSAVEDSEIEEEVAEEKPAPKKKPRGAKAKGRKPRGKGKAKDGTKSEETKAEEDSSKDDGEKAEEEAKPEKEEKPEPPPVPTDYVVHLYEFGNFTRTISREFTSEDAEAFAKEFNRTSSAHSRLAVAAQKDAEVEKELATS